MKEKMRVMIAEDFDEETNALAVITILLKRLNYDQQWRVINYVIIRLFGRAWSLAQPKADQV